MLVVSRAHLYICISTNICGYIGLRYPIFHSNIYNIRMVFRSFVSSVKCARMVYNQCSAPKHNQYHWHTCYNPLRECTLSTRILYAYHLKSIMHCHKYKEPRGCPHQTCEQRRKKKLRQRKRYASQRISEKPYLY